MAAIKPVKLTLSRRNLLPLLAKLDGELDGFSSHITIIKNDTKHHKYPLTGATSVMIKAVEDEEYYTDREPGPVLNKYGKII